MTPGFYDAVIFSTGAIKDADLDVPGIGLEGSFGGADSSRSTATRMSRGTGRWRPRKLR